MLPRGLAWHHDTASQKITLNTNLVSIIDANKQQNNLLHDVEQDSNSSRRHILFSQFTVVHHGGLVGLLALGKENVDIHGYNAGCFLFRLR